MTAQELYEIAKDVPREAWPAGMGYSECGFSEPVWISSCHYDDSLSFHEPALAEAAFVGAMVRHLIPMGNVVYERDGVFMCWNVKTEARSEAPTLIEALAAACKQKQEDDDGN